MRCPTCGFENIPGAGACGQCAAALPLACRQCGFESPAGFRYCGHCGAELGAAGPEARRSPRAKAADRARRIERRQLTVMFCDLAESTALSERLDPEEFTDVILAYREVCAEVVARYGGYIARYVGDGLLIYFGYPQAHDTDAANAARAGLEIVASVRRLGLRLRPVTGKLLRVHLGLHTGLVIVGDVGQGATSESSAVLGETPNIAARIEKVARPNTVLISRATYELVKDGLICRAERGRRLKGLRQSTDLFRVIAERRPAGKFPLLPGRELTPFANRHDELALLARQWSSVRNGAGQVAFISGEPGIGKSRLVQAFEATLEDDHNLLVCSATNHSVNNTLFPIIEMLSRQLALNAGGAAGRARRFKAMFQGSTPPSSEEFALLASLLSIPLRGSRARFSSSPQRQLQKTLDALAAWVVAQAEPKPLILLVEDLHWADATTLDLLTLLLDRVPGHGIFLMLTFRPEFVLPWPPHPHATQIRLTHLPAEDAERVIRSIATGSSLPEALIEQVAVKSDGVPLFIEELTKMVIEAASARDAEPGQPVMSSGDPAFAIPSTLQGSLLARLDRLGPAKPFAQFCAALGREFSHALIQAASSLDKAALAENLRRLVEAEFLYQRGTPPAASYIFKHSLIQDSAYHSLLRSERKEYHRRIAATLEETFPDVAEAQPELIAHHCALSGQTLRAVQYWLRAAKRANQRFALVEATAHLDAASEHLQQLPPSAERDQEEVRLLIARGATLLATQGYAAPEVEGTYARAGELCRRLGETPDLLPALSGLESFHLVHGPVRTARDLGVRVLRIAEDSGNPSLVVPAQRRLGWCLFCLGEMEAGRRSLETAVTSYDRAKAWQHIEAYGSDPGVLGLVNSAWIDWFLGFPRRAVRMSDEAIGLARDLSHPLSLAYALCMSAALYQSLGDVSKTSALARKANKLATEYGFPYWIAWSAILEGWAIAANHDLDEGMLRLREGIAAYTRTGAELFLPHSLCLLAETCANAGQPTEGLGYIVEARATAERIDAHFYDSEIHRLEGELILAGDASNVLAAEASFRRAVAVAARQGARALEARSRESLARASAASGRVALES